MFIISCYAHRYILPPPSRPRINDPDLYLVHNDRYYKRESKEVATSTTRPITTTSTTTAISLSQTSSPKPENNNQNSAATTEASQSSQSVNVLAIQRIPNFNNVYIVPQWQQSEYWPDKLNGKFNYKLKKYKAYEQKKKFPPLYHQVSLQKMFCFSFNLNLFVTFVFMLRYVIYMPAYATFTYSARGVRFCEFYNGLPYPLDSSIFLAASDLTIPCQLTRVLPFLSTISAPHSIFALIVYLFSLFSLFHRVSHKKC